MWKWIYDLKLLLPMNSMKIPKNDIGFKVPKIYWNFTSKKILCLDKVDGVSIREVRNLKKLKKIDLKKIS